MQYEWILQQISMPQLSRQLTSYIYVYKNVYKNQRNRHILHWYPSLQLRHVLGTFQPGQGQAEQPHSSCSVLDVWARGHISAPRCPSWGASCPCPHQSKAWTHDCQGIHLSFPKTYSLCNSSCPTRSTAHRQNHPNPRSVVSPRDQMKQPAWDGMDHLQPSHPSVPELQEQEIKICVNLKWSWQCVFNENFWSAAPLGVK